MNRYIKKYSYEEFVFHMFKHDNLLFVWIGKFTIAYYFAFLNFIWVSIVGSCDNFFNRLIKYK